MLHCFQCGADLPDNLVFCLHCGARLEDDDIPTVVNTPVVPPDDPRPVLLTPRTGSGVVKFVVGGLLGAGAVTVILIVLGIVLFRMQGDQGRTNTPANNKQEIVNTLTPTPTPAPRKPTHTPTAAPANNNVDTEAKGQICDIVNPAGGTVNLRRYCDTRDCSQDASTLYIQAEQGDIVELTKRKPVTNGRFTWVQVKYKGEILWISSTRINCH